MKRIAQCLLLSALAFGLGAPSRLSAQQLTLNLALNSQTFENGQTLPLSLIYNSFSNGVNACTPTGVAGGNQSPELSWTPSPIPPKSYVVVLFDTTASFTHWGLYNIAPSVTSLPMNAGVTGTTFGAEITNDFGFPQYDGPCPPPGLVHQYVFTVYALDTKLNLPLPTSAFPAYSETLFRAMIGHVLAEGSIEGNFASTPPA